jgi:hypothetical protein
MVSSIKRVWISSMVGFALLALTVPEAYGQHRFMPARPAMRPQQFHFNRNGFNRARPFFPPGRFRFDPFLRDRRGFDPFLRREFGFDPFLQGRFGINPFLGTGINGFPGSAMPPFLFGGPSGF